MHHLHVLRFQSGVTSDVPLCKYEIAQGYIFKKLLEVATKLEASFEASGREKGTQYTLKQAHSCILSTKSSQDPTQSISPLTFHF